MDSQMPRSKAPRIPRFPAQVIPNVPSNPNHSEILCQTLVKAPKCLGKQQLHETTSSQPELFSTVSCQEDELKARFLAGSALGSLGKAGCCAFMPRCCALPSQRARALHTRKIRAPLSFPGMFRSAKCPRSKISTPRSWEKTQRGSAAITDPLAGHQHTLHPWQIALRNNKNPKEQREPVCSSSRIKRLSLVLQQVFQTFLALMKHFNNPDNVYHVVGVAWAGISHNSSWQEPQTAPVS